MGHRGYYNVLDAYTAAEVRPRRSDDPRSDRRRLRGSLPEVRDCRTGARNVGGSTTSAVGVGTASQEKMTLLCSGWRTVSRRLAANG